MDGKKSSGYWIVVVGIEGSGVVTENKTNDNGSATIVTFVIT